MNIPDFLRIYYAEKLSKKDIEGLFSLLQAENIKILHPSVNKISVLDLEGEQFFVSEIDFLNNFSTEEKITFQIWINHKTDIVCSLSYDAKKNIYTEDYDLEGLYNEERIMFMLIFNKRISHAFNNANFFGVVMDYKGYLYENSKY